MLDPWGEDTSPTTAENQLDNGADWANFSTSSTKQDQETVGSDIRSFGDDFARKKFERLPDSSDYLSSLERKLSKIQGKKPSPSTSSTANINRDLLSGLSALRADRMQSFLAEKKDGNSSSASANTDPVGQLSSQDSNFIESDALYSSWLMQRIYPDRQALTEEELAALIRNDALSDQQQLFLHSSSQPGCEDAANQSSSTEDNHSPPPPADPTSRNIIADEGNAVNINQQNESDRI